MCLLYYYFFWAGGFPIVSGILFLFFYFILFYIIFAMFFLLFKFNGTQQFSRWFLCAWRRKKRAFFSFLILIFFYIFLFSFYYQVYPSVTIVVAIWQIHLSSWAYDDFSYSHLFFWSTKKCGESLSIFSFLTPTTFLVFPWTFWAVTLLKVPCILNHFQHAFCIHDVHLINKLKFKQGK